IEQLQTSLRGHQEFAKAAFERVSKSLRVELQKGRPNFAFVNAGDVLPDGPCFAVSPLDGMLNFMHGIPYFAVSVAIIENGLVTAGVIYNPATSDLYFAEKGSGAFKEGYRNHERLRVSSRKDLKDALIGAKDTSLAENVAGVRVNGCLSLDMASIAAGRMDAGIYNDNAVDSFAAGLLLVREAGGYVYEANQKDIRTDNQKAILESGNLVAGNSELTPKLFAFLHK
ncbi:MAG: inositol monophosphatase, partial [Alphaproteobacteria bacterium]|nr:inositol monophosphatase [Alphaproteobacteria bacterium]